MVLFIRIVAGPLAWRLMALISWGGWLAGRQNHKTIWLSSAVSASPRETTLKWDLTRMSGAGPRLPPGSKIDFGKALIWGPSWGGADLRLRPFWSIK